MVHVVAWLRPWVEELGIEVWGTDDLVEYTQGTEQLGLYPPVSHFHLMRRSERAVCEWREEIQTEWAGLLEHLRQG